MSNLSIRGLPTKPTSYKEFLYYIDGEKAGFYRYYIICNEKTIASKDQFLAVVSCSQAARQQIDLLSASGLSVKPATEPPIAPSPASKIRNTGNYFPDLEDAKAHGLFKYGNKPKRTDLYRAIAEFNSKVES